MNTDAGIGFSVLRGLTLNYIYLAGSIGASGCQIGRRLYDLDFKYLASR